MTVFSRFVRESVAPARFSLKLPGVVLCYKLYFRYYWPGGFHVKQVFRLSSALITALFIFLCSYTFTATAQAQATADPFVTQISSSALDTHAGDIDGSGRFVVFESTGDLATLNPGEDLATRTTTNNRDGNREIFLYDYAQRRIFQITNTTSARNNPANPFFSSTLGPSDKSNIKVEVLNTRPVISFNGRWIVFSSNASTPGSFDGDANSAALMADGNTEVFLYFIPAAPAVDLTQGNDVAFVNLAAGTFTQVTNTPASRLPSAGSATAAPFFADDNRSATVNDNASIVAFTSTRNVAGATNNDANPEVFLFNRNTGVYTQVTTTTGTFVFNENPSLSGDGSRMGFISTANIPGTGGASNNADGNSEIYLATIATSTTTVTDLRQVTNTPASPVGASVNIFSHGRRISRDGNLLGFESLADLAGGATLQPSFAIYIYNVTANSFTQVTPRTAANVVPDIEPRFPTFTGDNTTLIFTSALNLRANGTLAENTATDGLNPPQPTASDSRVQIWAAPVASPTTLTRLTNNPVSVSTNLLGPPLLRAFASNTRQRIAFNLPRTELGGGNGDGSAEVFYLLTPVAPPVSDTAGTISYFTGASERPVVSPSPTPTPPAVGGLSPGMLGIARSAVNTLAPSAKVATCLVGQVCISIRRTPPLPVELNGVSVSINGAAAGLYSVSPTQINFVVPVGLAPTTGTNTYPVVINNNGNLIRSTITIQAAQPDIFTSTMGPGGRALVFDVTNPLVEMAEPFTITATTTLRVVLTGVHGVQASQISIRVGTTDITGASILSAALQRDQPGFYQIDFRPPTSLAGAGDVPIIVTVTINNVTYTSRPADTAPRILIN